MTSTTTPARSRRLRVWSVGALALGTIVAGTALAFAGSGVAKGKADEYGQTGSSPVPVVETVNGKTKFKLASWNILGWDHTEKGGSKYRKGYANGVKRMKWAIQTIKSNEVDVIGLQEFQPPQYDKWVKRAGGQYDIWPGYTETEGFLRNSIAWRKDKFSMVTNTWVKLPYFKGDVLRMPVVLLKSLKTGQQFYVMNFQNPADVRGNAEKWRVMGQRWQIALVNQLRASNSLPIIWTGDMNTREQVFCRVTGQAGMVSANGGFNDGYTCTPPPSMLVDWIFGSGVKFKKYEQQRGGKIARTSDHHLLTTKVVMQPQAATVPAAPNPVVACTTPSAVTSTATSYPTVTVTPTPSGSPYPTTSPSTSTSTSTPTPYCATTTPFPVIFPTVPPNY